MSMLDDQEEPLSVSGASDNSFSSSNTTDNTEPSVIGTTDALMMPQLGNLRSESDRILKMQIPAGGSASGSSINLSSRQQLPTAIVAPNNEMVSGSGSRLLGQDQGDGISGYQANQASGSGGNGNSAVHIVGSNGDGNSPNPNTRTHLMQQVEEDSKRYCWVCFATDEDDLTATWVKPCLCRGTTKWVHQACIQRWIDEKQKGNMTTKVSCPQCNTEYYIYYPKQGSLVVIMDSVDTLISRVCPFVAAGIVVGSIYWTAVTYGAVTVMQVAGHKEGLTVMEQADPLVLLVGLPTIPILLILGKMVRWEDYVLRFIRNHSWKTPLLRHILPTPTPPASLQPSVIQDLPPLSDPVSATRILCGALLLPTVASLLGKALFENVQSNFKRALLGGMAFITIKGVLRIYHKQQQFVRQSERKIMDFRGPTTTVTSSASTSTTGTNTGEQEEEENASDLVNQ